MSSVNVQRRRWCEQDHATVSVESSTSSDRQRRWPDIRRNSVDIGLCGLITTYRDKFPASAKITECMGPYCEDNYCRFYSTFNVY